MILDLTDPRTIGFLAAWATALGVVGRYLWTLAVWKTEIEARITALERKAAVKEAA